MHRRCAASLVFLLHFGVTSVPYIGMRPSLIQATFALFLAVAAVSIGLRPTAENEKVYFASVTEEASSSSVETAPVAEPVAASSSSSDAPAPASSAAVECPENVYQQLSASDRFFDEAHNIRFDMGINPAWGTQYDATNAGIAFGFPMHVKQGNDCIQVRSYALTYRPYRNIDVIRSVYGANTAVYPMGDFTVTEWSDTGCGMPRLEVVGVDYNYQFSVPCGYPRTRDLALKDLQRFVATMRYLE